MRRSWNGTVSMGPADDEAGVSALRRALEYTLTGKVSTMFCKSCLQIPLAQDVHVVGDVPGDYVSEGAHGNRIVTRDACPFPRLRRQALEQRDRRETHVFELLDEVSPRRVVRLSHWHCDVLIEARQRSRKPTREPESPARKHPL